VTEPVAQPSWLAPLISVTTQLGVPTVFAGILLWFVLFRLGATLDNIEDNEIKRTQLLTSMQEQFVAAVQRQSEMSTKLLEKLEYCKAPKE